MTDLDTVDLSRVIERRANEEPDQSAVVFERGSHSSIERTTAGLHDRSVRLASALSRSKVSRGDTVAVMLRNEPAFVESILALMRLGLVLVPIDPRSRGEKLHYYLGKAKCSTIIVSDVIADEVRHVLTGAGIEAWIVPTEDGRAAGLGLATGERPYEEMLGDWNGETPASVVDSIDSPWAVAFTSGTTGDPKGIVLPFSRLALYRAITGYLGYRSDDVTYTGLSLTHGNALVVSLFPAIWGVVDHAVLSPWFTKQRLWEVCSTFGATTWSNLGGIATGVYSQAPSEQDRDHNVRIVISAGMPADLWVPFEERFGVKVLEWYGTMEGGFAYKPVDTGPIGSFGKPPADLIDMAVHDEDGAAVAPGDVGELALRPVGGASVVEYLDDPEASARKVRDGWLRTGDLVRTDADGWFYFQRRREETGLRRLGEFVSVGFVARAVAELDDVEDVYVYGTPAPSGAPGEVDLVVAVVPTGGSFDVDRFWLHCSAELEKSHLPDAVQVLDELPSTASGKVLTRVLAEQMAESDGDVHRRGAVT